MEIIKGVLYLAILLTSIPAGLLLAKLCEDELRQDRKYFMIFVVANLAVLALLLIFYKNLLAILALIYALAVILILFLKSKRK